MISWGDPRDHLPEAREFFRLHQRHLGPLQFPVGVGQLRVGGLQHRVCRPEGGVGGLKLLVLFLQVFFAFLRAVML